MPLPEAAAAAGVAIAPGSDNASIDGDDAARCSGVSVRSMDGEEVARTIGETGMSAGDGEVSVGVDARNEKDESGCGVNGDCSGGGAGSVGGDGGLHSGVQSCCTVESLLSTATDSAVAVMVSGCAMQQ